MKRTLVVLLVTLVVLGLSFGVVAEEPKYGGTLILGTIGDAEVINPVLGTTDSADEYADMVYEAVLDIDPDTMEPIPGPLCESFESSEDNLVWTFHLKKGVKFSDGHEFTAEDVKYTFEIIGDPNTNTVRAYLVEPIESIKIIDDYTIQFTLKYPFPDFLTGTMTMEIIPAHIFAGTDINTNPANQNPVGTGPFVLEEWVHDDHATFVAREDYHRGRVYLDKVIYKVVADQNALLAAAEAGDIDRASVPPAEVARLEREAPAKGLKLWSRWDFGYTYIGFNMEREIFKDVRVRKALAISIYKPAIVKVAYFGQGRPATSNVVPGIKWAYNPNIPEYEYNVDEAKRLLEEAGWVDTDGDGIREKDGKELTFTLITNKGNASREKVLQLAQNFWKKIGVKLEVDALTWTTFITERILKRDFDACVLGWTGMGPDPDDYSLFHSSQIEDGFNFVSYRNPEVDKLLEEGRTTMDIEKRKKIYYRIQELIHDDYPYIFLMYSKANAVFNEKVRGLRPSPLGFIHDWKDIWLAD
ncbi:hypothetical protein BBF96_10055 [Anoxybacter fermentans]|uniref:Solute-binding protein family 5 domain-containing protein n=1 Tax=Anoxybacter fermentans TaxID=1323375 RepID=A0A3S9SZK6_9FIRM|nr:peptide-binding protein [Anoxybacter fermentans]AZR73695.1 hypothetical protein BBF96_10055 [Anoxybacter fermentans]